VVTSAIRRLYCLNFDFDHQGRKMNQLMFILLISVVLLLILSVAALYFLYAPLPKLPVLTAVAEPKILKAGNHERTYLSYVPEKRQARPALVIALHGTGMNAVKMRQWTGYEFDRLADQQGFIVAYPDGYKGNWNDCRKDSPFAAKSENINDVDFVSELAALYEMEHQVDPDKVFVFGFSNGGQMAFRLATEKPQIFNAIAAAGANLPTAETFICKADGLTSRILLFAGTNDPISPYNGGVVSLFGVKRVGTAVSAQDTALHFAQRNDLNSREPVKENIADQVSRQTWKRNGADTVSLVSLAHGGHVIPQPFYRFPRIMGKTHPFNSPLAAIEFFELI
jgi:polyhydroxybutyrate depolymerase